MGLYLHIVQAFKKNIWSTCNKSKLCRFFFRIMSSMTGFLLGEQCENHWKYKCIILLSMLLWFHISARMLLIIYHCKAFGKTNPLALKPLLWSNVLMSYDQSKGNVLWCKHEWNMPTNFTLWCAKYYAYKSNKTRMIRDWDFTSIYQSTSMHGSFRSQFLH